MLRFLAALLGLTLCAGASGLLVVAQKDDDSLALYDTATGKLVSRIPVGHKPHEFAVSKDERFAYVTNYGADTWTGPEPGGNTISIVDLVKREAAGVIDLGEHRRPHGIVMGGSGLLYVTSENPPALLIVDAKKRRVARVIQLTGKAPHMVQLTSDERKAWTANAGSGTVSVVDLVNRRQMTEIEVGGAPMGFALDDDEKNLFVATRTNNMVVLVDAVANRRKRSIGVQGEPVRLAYSSDGQWLFVTLIGSGEVAVLDPRTLLERSRVPAGRRVEGVVAGRQGRFLYVSVQAENKVLQYSLPAMKVALEIPTAAKPDPLYLLGERRPH